MEFDIPIRYKGSPNREQPKGVKPKMKEHELRSGVKGLKCRKLTKKRRETNLGYCFCH